MMHNKDGKKCLCFACSMVALMRNSEPETKEVLAVVEHLPYLYFKASNKDMPKPPADADGTEFATPEALFMFVMGFSLAQDIWGMPAYATKELDALRGMIEDALKQIAKAAMTHNPSMIGKDAQGVMFLKL